MLKFIFTRFIHFLFFGVFFSNFLFAIDRTSIQSGSWNDPLIWNPNGVPSNNDNVFINHDVTIDSDVGCANVSIEQNSNLYLNPNINLIINGDLEIKINGTFTDNEGNTYLTGNFLNNGSFYSTGTFNFAGTSAQSISTNFPPLTFQNIIFSNNGTKNLQTNIEVNGNFILEQNSNVVANAFTHYINGNWQQNIAANFNSTNSTIIFNGSDLQTISNGTFDNVEFSNVGLKSIFGIFFTNIFKVNANCQEVNGENSTITISQSVIIDGNFVPANSTVLFDKNGTLTVLGHDLIEFNNIIVSDLTQLEIPTSKTIILNGNLTENGYVFGSIQKTENLIYTNVDYVFGNIGINISFLGNAPQTTTITRFNKSVPNGFLNTQAIKKYFTVTSTNSPSNATIEFNYDDREINSQIENQLFVWSFENNFDWKKNITSIPNETNNSILISNVQKFETYAFSSIDKREFLLNGNWNVITNWSPSGIPNNNDSVFLPLNKSCNITNSNAEVGSINIFGILSIQNNETLFVSKNFVRSGSFNFGTGTVCFNGNQNQEFSATEFYNIKFIGSGMKFSDNGFKVNGDFEIYNSTFDGKNFDYEIFGNWKNTGTFLSTGKIKFLSSNSQTIYQSEFYDLELQNGTKTALGNLTIKNNFDIQNNAQFIAGNYTHTIYGNFTNNGVFDEETSTINFASDNLQIINCQNFYNIKFYGNGNKTLNGNISILGNFENNGNFENSFSIDFYGNGKTISGSHISAFNNINIFPTASINVLNDIKILGNLTSFGIFIQTNGTTIFNGVSNLSGEVELNNVSISNGQSLTLLQNSNLKIKGNLTVFNNLITDFDIPNTVEFKGENQNVPNINYFNLKIGGSEKKNGVGDFAVIGDLIIESEFSEGNNNTLFLHGDILNNGKYSADGSILFLNNSTVSGSGIFNFKNFVNTDTLNVLNQIFVSKNFINNGKIFTQNEIVFNGNSNQEIISSEFENVKFENNGEKFLKQEVSFLGNVTIEQSAILNGEIHTHKVFKNWINFGSFISNGNTIFIGDTQVISQSEFYNLTIENGFKIVNGNITVLNDFEIKPNAQFDAGNYTHFISRNFKNDGNFIQRNSTIHFNGNNLQQIFSSNFTNIEFSGGGEKIPFQNLNISGNFIINNNSIFSASIFTHTISGEWNNNGIFNPNNSHFIFNKTGTQNFYGNTAFNNIEISLGTFLQVENSDTIFLNGNLLGSGYLLGKISKTENITNSITYTFGNIGAEISLNENSIGEVEIVRTTGIVPNGFDDAVLRYFSVNSSANSFNANLKLFYSESFEELNSQIENEIFIWSGNTNQTNWKKEKNSVVNPQNDFVEFNNINSFANHYAFSSNIIRRFSNSNGSWNLSTNWSPMSIPMSDDSVYIPIGISCEISDTAICKGIFIDGNLFFTQNSILLNDGDWKKNVLSQIQFGSNATVKFLGTNQNIYESNFGNLVFENGTKNLIGEIIIENSFSNSSKIISNSNIIFSKNGEANLFGNTTLNNVKINSSTILNIVDTLTFTGNLIENGFVKGILKKTENVSLQNFDYHFGNIGVSLSFSGVKPETTTVVRISNSYPNGFSNSNTIKRFYFIKSKSNPTNANLTLRYSDSEIQNIDESQLKIWRSFDFGNTWTKEDMSVPNSVQNLVSLSSLTSFGTFALSSSNERKFVLQNGFWNDAQNWIPLGTPRSNDSVVIPINSVVEIPNNFSAYTNHISIYGALIMSNGNLFVKGNWNNSNGNFVSGNGKIVFDGGIQSINSETFSSVEFFGNTKFLIGNIKVNDTLKINSNTILNTSNHNIISNGDWTNNGNFVSTSTVYFSSDNEQKIIKGKFYNVEFSGNGIKKLYGNLSFENFTINQNAIVNGLNSIDTVHKNWNNSGTFISNGSVIFNSNQQQFISQSDFNNVTFFGVGEKIAIGSLNINGNVTFNSQSTFIARNFFHNIGGSWTKLFGSNFIADSSTIIFDGNSTQIIQGSNFNDVVFSGDGDKVAFGSFDINGDIKIETNLDGGEYTHRVRGNFINEGIFTSNGRILFDRLGKSNVIGNVEFNELEIGQQTELEIEENSIITLQDSLIEKGYLIGSVQKTEEIVGVGNYGFGGIGLDISSVEEIGNVTVRRVSGRYASGFDTSNVVKRWYKIISENESVSGVVKMRFHRYKERNSQSYADMKVWRSINNGDTWRKDMDSEVDSLNCELLVVGFGEEENMSFSSQVYRLPQMSGIWSDSSIWLPEGVPTEVDSVYIPEGTSIIIPNGVVGEVRDIKIEGGVSLLEGSQLQVKGDLYNGRNIVSDGEVILSGEGYQSIYGGKYSVIKFAGLGVKELKDSIEVTDTMLVEGVKLRDGGNIIRVRGYVKIDSTIGFSGKMLFAGNTKFISGGEGSVELKDVEIYDTLEIINNIKMRGDWDNRGVFIGNNKIVLVGELNQKITNADFYDIMIAKYGGIVNQEGDIEIRNNFEIGRGSYNTRGNKVIIMGDMKLSGGNYISDSSKIYLYGDYLQDSINIYSHDSSMMIFDGNNQTIEKSNFYNLNIEGNGIKTFLDTTKIFGNLKVVSQINSNGVFEFSGNTVLDGSGIFQFKDVEIIGNLSDNSKTINVSGSWNNLNGNFYSTGKIIFNGSLSQNILQNNFYNITFANIGEKNFLNNTTISGDFTIEENSTFNLENRVITISGNFINNGILQSLENSKIILNGISKTIDGISNIEFYNLQVDGEISTQKDFVVKKSFTSNGNFIQTNGLITFGSAQSICDFFGSAQFNKISVPQTSSLRLRENSVLKILDNVSAFNNIDVFTFTPNEIVYNGNSLQNISYGNYFNLSLRNGNKTLNNKVSVNGKFFIDSISNVSGGDTLQLNGDFENYGNYIDNFGVTHIEKKSNFIGYGNFSFHNLFIGNGDTLNTSNLSINVNGDFTNYGKLNSNGDFIFNSNSVQKISNSDFYNLQLKNGEVNLYGNLNIENDLICDTNSSLNFKNSFIHIKGNLYLNGNLDSAKIKFFGGSLQSINSLSIYTFEKIVIDKAQNNVLLNNDIKIFDSLKILNGKVFTQNHNIILDLNSHLLETSNNLVIGNVLSDKFVVQNSNNNFNGIGFEMFPKNLIPGRTVVKRTTGDSVYFSGVGNSNFTSHKSIPRIFEVITTEFSNLNAQIKLSYNDPFEIQSYDEKTFRIWQTNDSGDTWKAYKQSALSDSVNNFVIADTSILNSRKTIFILSDANNSLQGNQLFLKNYRVKDTLFISDTSYLLKNWAIKIVKDSIYGNEIVSLNSNSFSIPNLENGKYFLIQTDSVKWKHIAYQVNDSLIKTSSNFIEFNLDGGYDANISVFNFHPNRIVVKNYMDEDSIFETSSDRFPILWNFNLSNNLININTISNNWTSDELQDGIYEISVRDSFMWKNIGKILDGNFIADTSKNIFLNVQDGNEITVEFIFSPTQQKYISFSSDKLIISPNKLFEIKTFPTIGNIIDTAFAKIFSKNKYGLHLGVPHSSKILKNENIAFISFHNKGSYIRKFIGKNSHTKTSKGFDNLFGEFKNPKYSEKFNNKLLKELITLKMNIAISDARISNSGFRNIIYSSDIQSPLNNKTIYEISNFIDTSLTYWRKHSNNNLSDTNYFKILFDDLQKINLAFDTIITANDFVVTINENNDSLYSPLKLKNVGKYLYKIPYLKRNTKNDTTSFDLSYKIPTSYKLMQNFPNPFNSISTIRFELPFEAVVSIDIYNILGQHVATVLDNEIKDVGEEEVYIDGNNFSSGIYFYKFSAKALNEEDFTGEFIEIKKIAIIK